MTADMLHATCKLISFAPVNASSSPSKRHAERREGEPSEIPCYKS